jgi:UDP-N-acetyl-2-amino-2-deoxyglucuronate dehydrogenase
LTQEENIGKQLKILLKHNKRGKNMNMQINNNEPIKFAIIGCGRISSNHIEAISALENEAKIVAVCDINKNALNAAKDKTGTKAYSSLSSLLNDPNLKVDVISVCTPSGLHPSQTIEAAFAKKHVITEKPMAIAWNDGLKMNNECLKNGVKLFVVKQNRYNTTLRLLKHALTEKRFGKIYNVAINVFWTRPQSYYDASNWRGTLSMDGGALMNQASHYVDLLTWLIGPINEVFAYCATQARKIEAEDSAVVNLKWEQGALGTLNVSMLTFPNNLEGSITIIGEKGTVRIGGVAVNEIQVWDFLEKNKLDYEIKNSNYEIKSVYGNGHLPYYKNVIETLKGKAFPSTDGNEGLKSLEVLCAIYQSSKSNKPICLPLIKEF